MAIVVDKHGNKKEVNTLIAGNTQLLKKYGYTLLTSDSKPEKTTKTEEKKSASIAVDEKTGGK